MNSNANAKRMARFMAVQAIFTHMSEHDDGLPHWTIEKIDDQTLHYYRQFAREHYGLKDAGSENKLFKQIIVGVSNLSTNLLSEIEDNLSDEWRWERMNLTTRAILLSSLFELQHVEKTPNNVIFSEYKHISEQFLEDQEIVFIKTLLTNIVGRS